MMFLCVLSVTWRRVPRTLQVGWSREHINQNSEHSTNVLNVQLSTLPQSCTSHTCKCIAQVMAQPLGDHRSSSRRKRTKSGA